MFSLLVSMFICQQASKNVILRFSSFCQKHLNIEIDLANDDEHSLKKNKIVFVNNKALYFAKKQNHSETISFYINFLSLMRH